MEIILSWPPVWPTVALSDSSVLLGGGDASLQLCASISSAPLGFQVVRWMKLCYQTRSQKVYTQTNAGMKRILHILASPNENHTGGVRWQKVKLKEKSCSSWTAASLELWNVKLHFYMCTAAQMVHWHVHETSFCYRVVFLMTWPPPRPSFQLVIRSDGVKFCRVYACWGL